MLLLTKTPLVSVHMITYNHDPYIVQAIEGVLQQKTNFPIELIIGEDCSTDRTREIVLEYQRKNPALIRILLSDNNVGAHKNSRRVSAVCRGKYIAYCEGDDYWIDPLKLQKQVDLLEANPDYGMVHGYCFIYNEKSMTFYPSGHEKKDINLLQGSIFEAELIDNCIYTCSACIRKDLIEKYFDEDELLEQRFQMGDYPLWLEISRHSKVGYITDPLGVYRETNNSASCRNHIVKRKKFIKSCYDVKHYYTKKYNVSDEIVRKISVMKAKSDLLFAFQLNNRIEATNIFENLLQYQDIKLDRDSYINYFGSRNYINRFIVKLFRRFFYLKKLIKFKVIDKSLSKRIEKICGSA